MVTLLGQRTRFIVALVEDIIHEGRNDKQPTWNYYTGVTSLATCVA